LPHRFVVVDLRLAVDEIPRQLGEAGPFLHDIKPGARREYRAFDLGAVADDAGVLHQPLDFLWCVARDFFRNEAAEGAAEILALAQNGDPRQAGLEAVEHKLFVERAVVELGHAPFLVVIREVKRVVFRPRTTYERGGVSGSNHSAALEPSGKAKRAQSG